MPSLQPAGSLALGHGLDPTVDRARIPVPRSYQLSLLRVSFPYWYTVPPRQACCPRKKQREAFPKEEPRSRDGSAEYKMNTARATTRTEYHTCLLVGGFKGSPNPSLRRILGWPSRRSRRYLARGCGLAVDSARRARMLPGDCSVFKIADKLGGHGGMLGSDAERCGDGGSCGGEEWKSVLHDCRMPCA